MAYLDTDRLLPAFAGNLHDHAIVVLDFLGHTITSNPKAQELLGFAAEERKGRPFVQYFSAADQTAGTPANVRSDAIMWGRYEGRLSFLGKDDRTVEAQCVVTPVPNTEGKVLGFTLLARPADAAPATVSAPRKILVLDDDALIRHQACQRLAELGYEIVQASSGAEALEMLAAEPGIDLLFTDVVMPDMTGREVADEARRARPELKVLFASGYFGGALVNAGKLDAGVALLAKPYGRDELARKLTEVLRP